MMFHDWTGSLVLVLCMVMIVAVFAVFVTTIAIWIWGREPGVVEAPRSNEMAYPPLREAA
ncbi:MAG TPA: hypothetical protein VJ746_03535 [Nitrospira sp.]|nr:hypothetical protein [Nitrospira sp.]